MRKYMLLFVIFLMSSNYTKAEEINPYTLTVEDAYIFYTKYITYNVIPPPEERYDTLEKINFFSSYYSGIKDSILFQRYAVLLKRGSNIENALNDKVSNCINKGIYIWFDVIFDRYKYNEINGKELFTTTLIKTINGICKII